MGYEATLLTSPEDTRDLPDLDALESAVADSDDFRDLITSPLYSRDQQSAAVAAIAKKMKLGATMANTYNSRPLVPEVWVDGDRYAVVAERIKPAAIMAAEQVPDWLK